MKRGRRTASAEKDRAGEKLKLVLGENPRAYVLSRWLSVVASNCEAFALPTPFYDKNDVEILAGINNRVREAASSAKTPKGGVAPIEYSEVPPHIELAKRRASELESELPGALRRRHEPGLPNFEFEEKPETVALSIMAALAAAAKDGDSALADLLESTARMIRSERHTTRFSDEVRLALRFRVRASKPNGSAPSGEELAEWVRAQTGIIVSADTARREWKKLGGDTRKRGEKT